MGRGVELAVPSHSFFHWGRQGHLSRDVQVSVGPSYPIPNRSTTTQYARCNFRSYTLPTHEVTIPLTGDKGRPLERNLPLLIISFQASAEELGICIAASSAPVGPCGRPTASNPDCSCQRKNLTCCQPSSALSPQYGISFASSHHMLQVHGNFSFCLVPQLRGLGHVVMNFPRSTRWSCRP